MTWYMATEKAPRIERRHVNDGIETVEKPSKAELLEAYDEARTLVKLHEDPTTKDKLTPHPVLPGVTRRAGDRINAIVAMRIQGYRDNAISELLDIPQPEPHRLERTYPDAFAKAEIIALTNADRKYKLNLFRIRAALSEKAPKMVEVLAQIAEDPNMKENVRRQAAIDILNLSGVGYSRQTVGGKDGDLQAGAKTFIQNVVNAHPDLKLDDVVTIEAEDAEVIGE